MTRRPRSADRLGALLLSSGAVEGPTRAPRAQTVSVIARMRRAIRAWLLNRKGTL